MSIGGVMYNIVDTPGIFDTQRATDVTLKEIAKSVHKCAYGLKAILVVFGMQLYMITVLFDPVYMFRIKFNFEWIS